MKVEEIPVVILCGGLGTRIREASEHLPKPLIDIGGRPILWHIMKLYDHYGFRRFILCLGYKSSDIKMYFMRYREMLADFTIGLRGDHQPRFENLLGNEDWEVTCAETGLMSGTGSRVSQVRQYIDSPVFMVTYGDGISNVDIGALLEFHQSHGAFGTVTGVRPTSRYGEMKTDGPKVVEFNEKPALSEGFVSGGFFVFDRRFLDYLSDDPDVFLEREPLGRLAQDDQLRVFAHDGFWMGMDTFRDYTELNQLWSAGVAPWMVWEKDR